jgi:MHS family proline/betaine transporter-like MFS transporter
MGVWSSLNREQKESVILLQTGTFLEYFDLMLYVHMAVLLNELFFSPRDPHSAAVLAAFTFCVTFVARPIGALILGWIGDHIGRKKTIVITTAMMAISCIVMANLPTYTQIGITASWIMIFCRIAQGMSSMGEIIGAEIYLTETIGIPARYPVTAFLGVSAGFGGLFALIVVFLVTSSGLNWRYAFWGGATVAIVGAVARIRLRETPEFLNMQKKWLKEEIRKTNLEVDPVHGEELNRTWKEPVNKKTLLSYFFISCGAPLCFYLSFIYFNPILKENFGYSPEDIIRHNLFLSLISVACSMSVTYLSYRVHPLKINNTRGVFWFFLMIAIPFLISNLTNATQLFLIQTLLLILALNEIPSIPVFYRSFPLYRRVTFASILFSMSRALMHIITSFGLIYLSSYFGHFGIWIVGLPTAFGFLYGINHFKKIERQWHKRFPNKKALPI